MQNELLDSVWGVAIIGGPILLGAILVWGMIYNSRRNKRVDAVTEAATRDQYEHPERKVPMP
jgi:hypothetical protein